MAVSPTSVECPSALVVRQSGPVLAADASLKLARAGDYCFDIGLSWRRWPQSGHR